MARPQREAIMHAVRVLDHPTADEIFQQVRLDLPKVALATVYRNLDALVADGDIQVRTVGRERRYDPLTHEHAHLHCTRCDRLVDVPHPEDGVAALDEAAAALGFQVKERLIELHGVCASCRTVRV